MGNTPPGSVEKTIQIERALEMLSRSATLLVIGLFGAVLSTDVGIRGSESPQQAGATNAYRTFTDQRGRRIEARVLHIRGDQVTIQRRDGREFTVPITTFSQADQDFLRQPAEPKKGPASGKTAASEPAGLAVQYPQDEGLERDAQVIFAEGFEGGALPEVGWEQLGGFYDLNGYPDWMHITDQEAAVGRHSLELVHPAHEVSPQWLHRKFPGQDTLFLRFYRKFEPGWVWAPWGIHDTYVFAGRYDSPAASDLTAYLDISGIDQRWSADNTLTEMVVSKQPLLVLKSSFQGSGLDFGIGREIISHTGWDNYYALPYNINRAPVLQGGRWYCFEVMAKMNRVPGGKDGELRLWVDDQLVTEMTGLVLRDDTHASTQWDHWMLGPRYGDSDEYGSGPPRELKSWIDGIVIATSRIGPASKANP